VITRVTAWLWGALARAGAVGLRSWLLRGLQVVSRV